ncbi:salicylate synthase [Flindersiella endophytica]
MTAGAPQRYVEREVPLAGEDPLTVVSRLAASGLHEDYVVYENGGRWSYAGGALAELSVDLSGARLRHNGDETLLPWDGSPLRQVQGLLDSIPIREWRAYGWATFELAYAKDGDVSKVGGDRLLHLLVPRTEVRVGGGLARLRSVEAETLDEVTATLTEGTMGLVRESEPLDVRRSGAVDYQRAVEAAVQDIKTGKYQKVIFSRVVPVEHDIDFVATYVSGRRGNSPARSFLLRLGGIEAAGFSPEIVVQVDGSGHVVSQPLAGTRVLTKDFAENERLRTDLLSDSKEIYEHAISVKVAYDELKEVCVPGSLTVNDFMSVKERGSVQHLGSQVAGQLAAGRHSWDAFRAVFPAVTASGVPKNAVYDSIRTQEGKPRGLYSGAVLTVDQAGAMDAALVLRSVYRQRGATWLQAGAGIVGQSRPEREFEETCEKLDSVARYLVPSQEALAAAHQAISRAYFA